MYTHTHTRTKTSFHMLLMWGMTSIRAAVVLYYRTLNTMCCSVLKALKGFKFSWKCGSLESKTVVIYLLPKYVSLKCI